MLFCRRMNSYPERTPAGISSVHVIDSIIHLSSAFLRSVHDVFIDNAIPFVVCLSTRGRSCLRQRSLAHLHLTVTRDCKDVADDPLAVEWCGRARQLNWIHIDTRPVLVNSNCGRYLVSGTSANRDNSVLTLRSRTT
jgi:hypothetical protein